MLTTITYKTKQFLLVLIKIGLVVAAFYFIYTKLIHNKDLHVDEFIHNLMSYSSISINTVLILVFLTICNWFFEILKWQTLVNGISNISLNEASAQSLGALTASLLTPNRIGEYGVKAMYYQPHLRKKIMILNLVGNSTQMAATTIFGTIGLLYFTSRFQPELPFKGIFIWFGTIGIVGVILILTLKTNGLKKQKKSLCKLLVFIKGISKEKLFTTTLFSVVRYLIFSFQFYYLLRLFDVSINYFEALSVISSMYLLSAIAPSIFIFDVVIKGGIAIYLFGLIGVSETIILFIVTAMWILNFVLPSVIGSYHVLNFKLPKAVS